MSNVNREQSQVAIAVIIAADLLHVLVDLVVQNMTHHGIPSAQVGFVRMIFTLILGTSYLFYTRHRDGESIISLLTTKTIALICVRGISASLLMYSIYYALNILDLSTFISIYHFRPFPTAFLCWLVLKENFSKVQIIACVISIVGLMMIIKSGVFDHAVVGDSAMAGNGTYVPSEGRFSPSEDSEETSSRSDKITAVIFTFVGLAFGAIDALITRMIPHDTDPIILMLAFATAAIFIAPIAMAISGQVVIWKMTFWMWMEAVLAAFLGCGAQVLLIMGLQRELGGRVAVLGYFQIPMSIVVQGIVIGTYPGFLTIIGMSIIITAGVWAALDHEKSQSIEQSPNSEPSLEDEGATYQLVIDREEGLRENSVPGIVTEDYHLE